MEYKYPSDEKFAPLCVDAEDREDAPHRAVGMLHCGPGQQNHFFEPMHQLGFLASYGIDKQDLGMPSFDKQGLGMPSFDKQGLGMPSFGKVNPAEKMQSRYNIENFYDARSTPVPLPPHLKEMAIRELKSPFVKSQVIILDIPADLTEEECKNYVRDTFEISYRIMQDMAPDVTFQPNTKDLKCKGSFTQDFCTVHFEAAVWRVNESQDGEKNVYIYEFRRKSISGRDAFEYLIRKMGAALKDEGRATIYGNGVEIFPPMEIEIPDDLGDLSMPSFGGMGSFTSIPKETNDDNFPISLDNDEQMDRMCKTIEDRQWPIYEETVRLFARCCCNSENTRIMAEHPTLQKVLIKELQLGSDSTNTHNVLTILYAILESASSEQSIADVEDGIMLAVTDALMTCSGLKQKKGASKVVRSVKLERAALKVLMLLSEKPKHYNQKQVCEVLQMLEEAPKKLRDELNQKHLGYVIENLKEANSVN